MRFTTRSTAKTTVEVLTPQHKLDGSVNIDSIQSILKNHHTNDEAEERPEQANNYESTCEVIPER